MRDTEVDVPIVLVRWPIMILALFNQVWMKCASHLKASWSNNCCHYYYSQKVRALGHGVSYEVGAYLFFSIRDRSQVGGGRLLR